MNTQSIVSVVVTLPKVTKKQALEDVIDRLITDRPMGWDAELRQCKYSTTVGGGCAIGTWIPRALWTHTIEGESVQDVFAHHSEISALFEDPDSSFWGFLQVVHDYAAKAVEREGDYNIYTLQVLQEHLLKIAGMEL